ncbi:MAG: hypothetical protein WAS05_08430 [Candidatus Nanopelagicales bacterium]
MRTTIGTFLTRATGDGLVSWVPFVWITFLGALDGLLSRYSENSIHPVALAGVISFSSLVMFACLYAWWFLVLRHLKGRPRIVVTLISFGVVGLIRGLVIAELISWVVLRHGDAASFPNFGMRTAFYVVVMILALSLGTYIVQVSRDNRSKVSQVASEQESVQLAIDSVEDSITEEYKLVGVEIQEVLSSEIREFDQLSPEQAAQETQRVISEVVRPLNDELAYDRPTVTLPQVNPNDYRVTWSSLWSRERVETNIAPLTTVAVYALYIYSSITMIYNYYKPLAVLLTLPALWIGLWCARFLFRKYCPRVGLLWRLVLSTLLLSIVIAPSALIFELILKYPDTGGPAFVYWVTAITIVWLVAIANTQLRSMRQADRSLEEIDKQLVWCLVRGRMTQLHEAERIARVLHGPIQSELIAYRRQLNSSTRETEQPANNANGVDQQTQALVSTLTKLLDTNTVVAQSEFDLRKRVTSVSTVWTGIADVTIEANETTLIALEQDVIASDTLLRIVEESVSNLIRTSGATTIMINIRLDSDQTIVVELNADVQLDKSTTSEKLVQDQLRDCTINWTNTQKGNCTTFTLTLPVAPNAITPNSLGS